MDARPAPLTPSFVFHGHDVASVVRRFINFVSGSQPPRLVERRGRGKRAANLTPWMPTYQDWDVPDIDAALAMAETGNMQMVGRICDALLGDGAIVGQLSTRFDGLIQLPRSIEGPCERYAQALREDFDTLCSPSELGLIARDGGLQNCIFGELIENEDGVLRLVRRNPEFLTYRFSEGQWYVRTAHHGLEPVNPGDGRWLLAFPHGSDYPWRYGLWRPLSFAYINRRQSFLNLNAWNNSLAFPIKKLTAPKGANEEEVDETFDAINHFGPFPAIRLNEGWDFDLVQPSQATPTSLKDAIEAAKEEIVLAVSGQSGTTDPGPGFGNVGYFAKMKSELVQGDAKTLAIALNEQVIPVWAQRRFSFDGWFHAPKVSWDTTPPKDRASEANAANTSATAAKAWQEAITASGSTARVDVAAMAKQYGIPVVAAPAVAHEQGQRVLPDPGMGAADQGQDASADPPSDEAAATLADKMTEHGVERCEHNSSNRCRLCGIERVRDFAPGVNGGDHQWKVAWRPICPAPAPATAVQVGT